MGSPPDEQGRSRDELQHPVEISRPFAIGVSEVSQRLWEDVMGNNPLTISAADSAVRWSRCPGAMP